jgi:ankyrin repeat protein
MLSSGSKAYDHAYEEAMKRIKSQNSDSSELAQQVIVWITCAKRRLTTSELLHALGVELGERKFDADNIPQIENILSVCEGLVTVDDIIRLCHYTMQEYFERILERTESKTLAFEEKVLAETCLTYLKFDVFSAGPCASDSEMNKRVESWPFLQYAATNWGYHAQHYHREPDTSQRIILPLLKSKGNLSSAVQAMKLSVHQDEGFSQQYPKGPHALWLASHFDLEEICKILLHGGVDIDAVLFEGSSRRTAIHEAAKMGCHSTMKLLLEHGAQMTFDSGSGMHVIHEAARRGHPGVVELLLQHGVDVNTQMESGRTALHEAASNGHQAVIRLLLGNNASINARTEQSGWAALHSAVAGKHESLVRFLLKRAARISSKPSDAETPLHIAVATNQLRICCLLLDASSNVSDTNCNGDTITHIAASNGSNEILTELANRNVSFTVANWKGETPLHSAARSGQTKVLEFLMDCNSEINCKTLSGKTSLHIAAENGHLETVESLLRRKADAQIRCRCPLTGTQGMLTNYSLSCVSNTNGY